MALGRPADSEGRRQRGPAGLAVPPGGRGPAVGGGAIGIVGVAGGRRAALFRDAGGQQLALEHPAAGAGHRRPPAHPDRLLPRRDVLQQLPAEQHRRRRGPRPGHLGPRQLAHAGRDRRAGRSRAGPARARAGRGARRDGEPGGRARRPASPAVDAVGRPFLRRRRLNPGAAGPCARHAPGDAAALAARRVGRRAAGQADRRAGSLRERARRARLERGRRRHGPGAAGGVLRGGRAGAAHSACPRGTWR